MVPLTQLYCLPIPHWLFTIGYSILAIPCCKAFGTSVPKTYDDMKKDLEAEMRLQNQGVDPDTVTEMMEAIAGGDTSVVINMKDVEMAAPAQSSKDDAYGSQMGEDGSQVDFEDTQPLFEVDLRTIPEESKVEPDAVVDSSDEEDEDEDAEYDYEGMHGNEASGWQEPANKKRKVETQLEVLQAK